ncbi:hypothetical protein VTJ83DRAFT_197 [Remersonia thermophila]|uniref:Amidase domain-containing protein n=1 Tax=Remersonia thermophila TaxID=72144 RepID=A0ABR4DKB2_9PEZI
MASKNKRFANHPGCKQAPEKALEYRRDEDKNPPLNGLPLAIASAIVPYIPGLFKLLWHNAKFGQVRHAPGLQGVTPRYEPNVIPLAEGPGPASPPPIGPDLCAPQPADLAGRFASAADYHALYRSGKATPVQVVEAVFRTLDDASSEHRQGTAWVQLDERHRERVMAAAARSAERWAQGKPLGIMDGVPFGVKDDVDVHLYVSTMGMRVDPTNEYFKKPAQETCWPVVKLLEAGGILVGKMNQHEIGMDTTGCNPSTGTPVNWYNTSYYPGGSSSGAGSALSGGVVPIAVGTDAGGSCRIPASFCGVYGLKPTHNRLCHKGSTVCVVGLLTATAADMAIAYRIAAQPNPDDPAQNVLAASAPPEPLQDPAGGPREKKLLGICPEWVEAADPEVRAVFDASVDDLVARCGYARVDIRLPYLREAQWAHSAICLAESVVEAEDRDGGGGGGGALGMLNAANRLLVGTGAQTPATDFFRYAQLRQVVMAHLGFLFREHPGLILLSPTTPMAGWPRAPGDQRYGSFDGNRCLRNMTYAWLANMSGCPALSMPAGYAEPKQGEGRLPVGLMAMGEWGEEEQLLAFAREREAYLNHRYPGGRRRPERWVDVIRLAEERGEEEEEEEEEKQGREEAEGAR